MCPSLWVPKIFCVHSYGYSILINLEDTNADLIRQKVPQIERLKILREKAYRQLELLTKNQDTIEALKKNLIKDC